ncbi:hypothetical protein UA08_09502 [Talaromyces atroroseus]|uniref:Aminoglycoside phosphotransferase domain-containing protein n=1 Tax=Talaromyces atroroseus TaxID=1441469 RepID=A0A1Q5Q619_TALAT|nr:hypothetical protein UA08_09502 [Talaromyces atroroseus]OKL55233.1 hypothetical protein UA08_09502 [Talaromyces atroroseus]
MDAAMDTASYQIQINDQPVTVIETKQLDPQRSRLLRLKIKSAVDLPETIIVKQKREYEEANEFQCEKEAYERLQELQGVVIPIMLGEGLFCGVPALFLSEVDGKNLHDLARNSDLDIEMGALEAELGLSLDAFSKKGAVYWDQRLDNFMLCQSGKVMVIDLEHVKFPKTLFPWETTINSAGVSSLLSRFKDTREPNRPSTPVAFWNKTKIGESVPSVSFPALG